MSKLRVLCARAEVILAITEVMNVSRFEKPLGMELVIRMGYIGIVEIGGSKVKGGEGGAEESFDDVS